MNRSALVAAAILATLTLITFGLLQNYGPASAIRRFHAAVARGDIDEAARTIQESPQDPNAIALARWVRTLTTGGRSFRILRMERLPREVRAVVVYDGNDGLQRAVVWVVEKQSRSWRISARKTWTILRDLGATPVVQTRIGLMPS